MRLLRQRDIIGKILLRPKKPEISEFKGNALLLVNPLTREPYIPGSHFKDCMHAMLLKKFPDQKGISFLFGMDEKGKQKTDAPMRLVMRDALPSENMGSILQEMQKKAVMESMSKKLSKVFAKKYLEAMPELLKFDMNMGVRIYNDAMDKEEELLHCAMRGLQAMDGTQIPGAGCLTFQDLLLDGDKMEISF